MRFPNSVFSPMEPEIFKKKKKKRPSEFKASQIIIKVVIGS